MKLTKTIIGGTFVIGMVFLANIAGAQMGMMGTYEYKGSIATSSYSLVAQNKEVQDALRDIYAAQHVDVGTDISCNNVTDAQFEKLGDAYMGVMVPNEARHEAMDTMMGGEGSASLVAAHVNMGRSYLGCWSNYSAHPVYMPMMSGYGSGWNMMQGTHRYPGWWSGYGFLEILFNGILWIFAFVGIVAIIKWVFDQKSKK
ncbi:MAG: hypothetical protein KGI50_03140 [Patescibacteria group bacterium]|nr:hypothetical protein [Patescibacteria group bacterium]MDE2438286.1 hypothetical protein [Patescibacteria group bacterium]